MIEKLDKVKYTMPSARAALSGVGNSRQIMLVDKINEIIDSLTQLAVQTTVNSINNQVSAMSGMMTDYLVQLNALTSRVTYLEFPSADAIPDVSTTGINISVFNLAALGLLNTQAADQAKAINKILAVMRTRKEIK